MTMLEIPVCLVGPADADGNTVEKVVTARINPNAIHGYYPGYNWGSIIILSGHTLLTMLSCEEIDTAMVAYNGIKGSGKKVEGNICIQKTPAPVQE